MKIKNILTKKSGVTLVESVVAFALSAILLTMCASFISSASRAKMQTEMCGYAQSVSDILMDKICGEIAGAQVGVKKEYTLTVADSSVPYEGDETLIDFPDHAGIAFYNRSGSPIYITKDSDNLLLIHFRPISDDTLHLDATDWKFSENVYMGYEITELTFSILENGAGRKTNVIKVNLEIHNKLTNFDYSCARYVECYNFNDSMDMQKMSYGPIIAD